MSEPGAICQAVEDRLLDGEKLTGHPELVEHVGSCLECFRTLSELRDLPRFAEVMRAGAAELAEENDPGSAFWRALPNRIADEVLGAQRPPETVAAPRPSRRWWAPAALMSAGLSAAAAMLVVTLHRPVVPSTTATTARPAAAATLAVSAESDDNLSMGELASLGASELRALNHRLTQEEAATLRVLDDPGTDPAADPGGDDDGEGTAMERLVSLNGPQLQRLTHSLGLELE